MSKMNSRRLSWLKKKVRTKHSLGTFGKYPRLVVFKSNKHIYGQLIDDISCKTLLSASTMDKGFNKKTDTRRVLSLLSKSLIIFFNISRFIFSF